MNEIIVFDSVYLTILTVNVIPFLVSLITNQVTRKGVKEGLLFIVSGAATWLDEVVAENGVFTGEDFALTWAAIFFGSVGMFWGWQHRTITPALERSGLSVGAPKQP